MKNSEVEVLFRVSHLDIALVLGVAHHRPHGGIYFAYALNLQKVVRFQMERLRHCLIVRSASDEYYLNVKSFEDLEIVKCCQISPFLNMQQPLCGWATEMPSSGSKPALWFGRLSVYYLVVDTLICFVLNSFYMIDRRYCATVGRTRLQNGHGSMCRTARQPWHARRGIQLCVDDRHGSWAQTTHNNRR